MLLLTHITIAFGGMVLAGLAIIWPSRSKLLATYGLIAGTLISGTALVIISQSNLVQSCVSGLLYLAAVGGAAILGRRRLVAQEQQLTGSK